MSQPSVVDFTAPFDPTSYPSISGAQLLQLVSGLFPSVGFGLNFETTDIGINPAVPNATSVTKWQVYLWIRQLTTSTIVYVWSPNAAAQIDVPSGASLLQWIPISTANISINSLNANVLLNNSITPAQISSVAASQITPSLASTFAPLNQALVGGDLTGNMPGPTIALGVVTGDTLGNGTGKIAANTIVSNNIKAQGLNAVHDIAGNGTASTMLRSGKIASSSTLEFFQGSSITDAANGVVTTGNQFKIPQVATAGAGDSGTWQMVSPGVILQSAQVSFTSALVALSTGTELINSAHGLGSTPMFVRAVVVNQDATLGYSIGDEVDAQSFQSSPGSGGQDAFTFGASATNVFATMNSNGNFYAIHKTTGVQTLVSSLTSWKIKIYARL